MEACAGEGECGDEDKNGDGEWKTRSEETHESGMCVGAGAHQAGKVMSGGQGSRVLIRKGLGQSFSEENLVGVTGHTELWLVT